MKFQPKASFVKFGMDFFLMFRFPIRLFSRSIDEVTAIYDLIALTERLAHVSIAYCLRLDFGVRNTYYLELFLKNF